MGPILAGELGGAVHDKEGKIKNKFLWKLIFQILYLMKDNEVMYGLGRSPSQRSENIYSE